MITHHSVMTLSLRIKIKKIDKFGDFSCDFDHNRRTYIFSDVFSFIIDHCDPWRLKGASGLHKVSARRVSRASEARSLSIYRETRSLYIFRERAKNNR